MSTSGEQARWIGDVQRSTHRSPGIRRVAFVRTRDWYSVDDEPPTRQKSEDRRCSVLRPDTINSWMRIFSDKNMSEITDDFAEFVTVSGVRPDDRSRRGSCRSCGCRQRIRGCGNAAGSGGCRRRRWRRHFTAGWHYNVPVLLMIR